MQDWIYCIVNYHWMHGILPLNGERSNNPAPHSARLGWHGQQCHSKQVHYVNIINCALPPQPLWNSKMTHLRKLRTFKKKIASWLKKFDTNVAICSLNTMWKFYEIKNGWFLFISLFVNGYFTFKSMRNGKVEGAITLIFRHQGVGHASSLRSDIW